ncbi:YhgE/Pip domain-containing protein [Liquorilactobacillus satsumensis]|nr:YhgE/Pip domain-containing protein [Liquorilactobacillus satsumensis]
MNMIKEEFKNIGRHKILVATIFAVMIVPFLYSVFFLKSVWDPYGNTGSLPVALVNQDRAVKYQGKKLQVGHDLVKQLRKNDDLEWHFVSKKQAAYGLAHKKYYTVITIPKQFSKNATTILDKEPRKMKLKYETNDSLNYIGKVISEEGVKQLNNQVRKSVTKAYASAMFATLKKIGGGFSKAASGAGKLKQGTTTLSNGINTYTAGVSKLNDGVIQLQTGVVPLGQGVIKLTTGATALKKGVAQYTTGVAQVNAGTQQLNNSTGTLATGVQQLATGSKSLTAGINQYTGGVNQANSGVQTLNAKTGTLASGVQQLATGSSTLTGGVTQYTAGVSSVTQNLNKLAGKSQTLNAGASQLVQATSQLPQATAGLYVLNSVIEQNTQKIVSQITSNQEKLTQMKTQMKNVSTQTTKVQSEMDALSDDLALLQSLSKSLNAIAPTISQLDSQLSQAQTAQTTFTNKLATSLSQIGSNSTAISKLAGEVANSSTNTDEKEKMQQIIALSTGNDNSNAKEAAALGTAAQEFKQSVNLSAFSTTFNNVKANLSSSKIQQLTSATDKLTSLMTDSKNLLATSQGMTNDSAQAQLDNLLTLTNKATEFQQLTSKAAAAATQLYTGVNGSAPTLDANQLQTEAQLSAKVNELSQNSKTTAAVKALAAGINSYTAGANQLSAGAGKLNANSSALVSGTTQLATGLGTLNNNVPALTSGITQLANGTGKLAAKSGTLNQGAVQLTTGLGTLNSNVPVLTAGIAQLASGTKQLNDNSQSLNTGATQLATGLGQLNSKVPTLTTGVSQLASGTSQLKNNSPKLQTGATQLAAGNKTLAKALAQGARQVNGVKTSAQTADMFAAPSNLVHKNYSKVPNYGYALAPYMLSVALYVGALVFNLVYPVRRLASPSGTGTDWFFSKVTIGGLVATGNALVETLLMMAAGLTPDHPLQLVLNALVFSLTAMYLIMFLSVAGSNPGRFAAMILLVIQLGASGGSFPIEITKGMNGFFQAINPFLPMTYSIYGFREALTSGLGTSQVSVSIGMMLLFMITALGLLWVSMLYLRRSGAVTYVETAKEE